LSRKSEAFSPGYRANGRRAEEMPRDMFGAIVDPHVQVGSRGWYMMPLSVLLHAAAAVVIVAIPLMATDVLPSPAHIIAFYVPETPVPPEPTPPQARQASRPVIEVNPNAAPVQAPRQIGRETLIDLGLEGVEGGVHGGIPKGVVEGVVLSLPGAPPPPPPPDAPIPVGGDIKRPAKVRDVTPVYPAIAQAARVEGFVIIEAIIGPDGRVRDAKVLRSIQLLDQAALEAVRQWEFTPTLLNGVPVPIIMTVTVNFKLQ
jgi:periplasmic protein TonB